MVVAAVGLEAALVVKMAGWRSVNFLRNTNGGKGSGGLSRSKRA
jgi:hypothetical protein